MRFFLLFGFVEILFILGVFTIGVLIGRRVGLGLGIGGGSMRRGEVVFEGICDRGCWILGIIFRGRKCGYMKIF